MVRSLKSPSFWIALLALAESLGGTAFAAGLISGKSIRKDSIPGDRLAKSAVTGTRVKDNSLTGADVAESKLGLVPRAKIADRASVVGAARDTGLLGGDPPARYVRYGRAMTAGYTASGAWGCDTGRTCVVSLPASSTVAVGPVAVAPAGGCGG